MDEFYGRNMADVDFDEAGFVPLAQVYGRYARIFNEHGEEFFDHTAVSWSELDLVQATAHQPGARAWYLLDERALDERVRYGTVRELVAAAPTRTDPAELPFEPPPGTVAAVRVAAAITHTIGGLRVDERARVARRARRADRRPLRRGRRRRRDLDRRLRERPGLGARPRPSGRRDRAQLTGCR